MSTPLIRSPDLSLKYLTDDPHQSEEILNHNIVVIVRGLSSDWWSRWIPSTCTTSQLAQKVFQMETPDVGLAHKLYKKLTEGFKSESWTEWLVRKLRWC